MDCNFSRKSRLVTGGHNTEPPMSINYSSVVTRYMFRLELLIAGMNDLNICVCGIVNAYLNDPCQGKLWTGARS